MKCLAFVIITLIPIALHSQIEEGLYCNFDIGGSSHIQESAFAHLKIYELSDFDSLNIEMIKFDSSDLINDELEIRLIRQGILLPFVELNIKGNTSDTLEALDFYMIGKLKNRTTCDLYSYLILMKDLEELSRNKVLLGLNFKNGHLRSVLNFASYWNVIGPQKSKSYFEEQACDSLKIRIRTSFEFNCGFGDIYHDTTALIINSQGEIHMLE